MQALFFAPRGEGRTALKSARRVCRLRMFTVKNFQNRCSSSGDD
jgi:hypothetical protein